MQNGSKMVQNRSRMLLRGPWTFLGHFREHNSFACTRKNLVHAQGSCACTRILCTHKNLVHAQEPCACTRFLCVHSNCNDNSCFCQNTFFHEWAPYGRWGGHRTAEIRVAAMRVFFICMTPQKKLVFRPVDVS